ncbi:hypothetical protein FQZ97_686700 [compost metagenome]
MPGGHHAPPELVGAPFGGALLDLRRRKEQRGARAAQALARALGGELLHVRAADRAAVLQVGEALVDRGAQFAVAGEVDVHAGGVGRDAVQRVVGHHAVVAAQALAEGHVGGRGEADHLDAVALVQLEGRAVGRLARGARQQHGGGAEEVVVGHEVVDQPRGDEQRAQQRLQVFGVGGVQRVGVAAEVLVVDRGQLGAVRRRVGEARGREPVGAEHRARGHRPVAVEPFAHGHARVQRLHHAREAPHRDAAPAFFLGGKELPVAHRIAEGGVGDVVGGERKAVDAHAHLAVGQRPVGGVGVQARGGQLVFADQEVGGAHGVDLHGCVLKTGGGTGETCGHISQAW